MEHVGTHLFGYLQRLFAINGVPIQRFEKFGVMEAATKKLGLRFASFRGFESNEWTIGNGSRGFRNFY